MSDSLRIPARTSDYAERHAIATYFGYDLLIKVNAELVCSRLSSSKRDEVRSECGGSGYKAESYPA